MPKKYHRKRNYRRKRGGRGKYRNRIARIIRQPTLKPKAAVQKFVYYQTFFANNVLNAQGAQQMLLFDLQLNSVYPFDSTWNQSIGNNVLNPNTGIIGYGGQGATTLPGFNDGYQLKNQYAQYLITGSKTTITANPMVDTTNVSNPSVLFAVKHSQNTAGVSETSTYSTLQKLPNRKVKNIRQVGAYSSGVGAKLVVYHSVRKFNSKKDLQDCNEFFGTTGGQAGTAGQPTNMDRLTIGIVGKCNTPDTPLQAGKFCINLKHEVNIRFSEMLEAGAYGGNYSFPRSAAYAYGAAYAAGMGYSLMN
jgi:hypothetical protein